MQYQTTKLIRTYKIVNLIVLSVSTPILHYSLLKDVLCVDRSRFQTSARKPGNLTDIFRGFLSFSRQIPRQYQKLVQKSFLQHYFQLIIY
jgi:hypothetical protein